MFTRFDTIYKRDVRTDRLRTIA